jgi:hypothetical protein
VIFVGGETATGASTAVDIFNTAGNGTVTQSSPLPAARALPGLITLKDGRVFAIGGKSAGATPAPLASVDTLPPAISSWSPSGSLTVARAAPAVARTTGDSIFVFGGQTAGNAGSTAIEGLYPTMNFAPVNAGALSSARYGHMAAVLDDDRVLIAGGAVGQALQTATDVFTPGFEQGGSIPAGTIAAGPVMSNVHYGGGAARMSNGLYLFVGGCTSILCTKAFATCDAYTPVIAQAGTFTQVAPLSIASHAHSVIALPTGRVLVAGGSDGTNALSRAEVYDPVSNTWTTVGPMSFARYDAAIAVTGNGKVVIAGGRSDSTTWLKSVEIFDPGPPTLCRVCQVDGTCQDLTDGTACDDGVSTTTGETCKSGACKP